MVDFADNEAAGNTIINEACNILYAFSDELQAGLTERMNNPHPSGGTVIEYIRETLEITSAMFLTAHELKV